MNEVWKEIDNFYGYSVSSLGQVRNDKTGRILRIRLNREGIPYVGLMRDGVQYVRELPRLVAKMFLPASSTIFDTPINKNGDRKDCSVDNLVWRPRWYAVKYNNQFIKARYPHPIRKSVRLQDTDYKFPNSLNAACTYGILEEEVVMSILNNTCTWPTYQFFELAH